MIVELKKEEYIKILSLLNGQERHPVINGVIDGNNRGCIYVDQPSSPTTAFVWATNEMFYLIGDSKNQLFNSAIESLMIKTITPEAIAIGEEYFNLELYPHDQWQTSIEGIFRGSLKKGERVPFVFQKERFSEYCLLEKRIPAGYVVSKIDHHVIDADTDHIIKHEILKFWDSLEKFYQKGMGYCVMKENEVIGTCISAFVSKGEYEIGINTYKTEHRGKGLATLMAAEFIRECLEIGGTPHWTTEFFRVDSIAIANKLGFRQLPNYPVYYLPFKEFQAID